MARRDPPKYPAGLYKAAHIQTCSPYFPPFLIRPKRTVIRSMVEHVLFSYVAIPLRGDTKDGAFFLRYGRISVIWAG